MVGYQQAEALDRHQRHQQHDRDEVVQRRALLQQQGDGEAEKQFQHDRGAGIEQRHLERIPELRISEEGDVVVAPVELPRPGLAQPVV